MTFYVHFKSYALYLHMWRNVQDKGRKLSSFSAFCKHVDKKLWSREHYLQTHDTQDFLKLKYVFLCLDNNSRSFGQSQDDIDFIFEIFEITSKNNHLLDLFQFIKVFFKEECDFLERTFQKCAFGQKLKVYVEACIEQMWLMCVQDPQMTIHIAVPGTPIDKDLFKFYNKKGKTVHLTVWPVVYLHKDGPLVSKGYVLPK